MRKKYCERNTRNNHYIGLIGQDQNKSDISNFTGCKTMTFVEAYLHLCIKLTLNLSLIEKYLSTQLTYCNNDIVTTIGLLTSK